MSYSMRIGTNKKLRLEHLIVLYAMFANGTTLIVGHVYLNRKRHKSSRRKKKCKSWRREAA